MFKAIEEVKPQYLFAVQPVQLFETKKAKKASDNPFEKLLQTNNSNYNLLHPNVSNSKTGKKLDLMS